MPREIIKANEQFFMQNVREKKGGESEELLYLFCPTLFSYTFSTDCCQRQGFGLDRHLHVSVWLFLYSNKMRNCR